MHHDCMALQPSTKDGHWGLGASEGHWQQGAGDATPIAGPLTREATSVYATATSGAHGIV